MIKGIESNENNVYEERNKLLGLEEKRVIDEIKKKYIKENINNGKIYKDIYGKSDGICKVKKSMNIKKGCDGMKGIKIYNLKKEI